MITHLSFVPLSLLAALLILPLHGAQADKSQTIQFEGLTITMTLQRRPATVQNLEWPTEPIVLKAQTVSTKGRTIHELLRENHIFPDVEAFNVVYALNPDIQKLSNIDVPQIRIPVVPSDQKLEKALGSGFTVLLMVDNERKQRFNESVKSLNKTVQIVLEFDVKRFQDPAARESITKSLNAISVTLNAINKRLIQRFGRPIHPEALAQLDTDVELLNNILGGKASSGAQISKAELDQIVLIEKDVTVKGRAYLEVAAGEAPDRWPNVEVIVKTLRQGANVPDLRIYFVPEAHKTRADKILQFGKLSSPTTRKLDEADYCFWGARDPDRSAVTNEVCVPIRKNGEREIDLTVIR